MVGIIGCIELHQKAPGTQNHLHYLGIFTANERFTRQAFLILRFHHNAYLH